MASWVKAVLFGRQLSHGSDTENPQSFEEALQQLPDQLQQNVTLRTVSVDSTDSDVQQQQPSMLEELGPTLKTGATPGAKDMSAAYNVSNQLVRERMERENPEDIKILDSVKESDIVCVRGTYDHIHLVLSAIGVPFAHISPDQLLRTELKPNQVVYVNCPSSFPRDAAVKLSAFVEAGGMLITTDWALKHVIEVAFPNTIKFNGNSTGDEVVSVEIVDTEDEVLKGFIDQEKDAAPVWWLEGSSYPIKILDKKRVKVLLRSDDLKRRYKDDSVIVSFEWGKGMVYHMISHFYLQRSETRTQKQGTSASNYAKSQNMSQTTMSMFEDCDKLGVNYGTVQSAATSSEFVSRVYVKQNKRSSGYS